jgi:hypothetical protein
MGDALGVEGVSERQRRGGREAEGDAPPGLSGVVVDDGEALEARAPVLAEHHAIRRTPARHLGHVRDRQVVRGRAREPEAQRHHIGASADGHDPHRRDATARSIDHGEALEHVVEVIAARDEVDVGARRSVAFEVPESVLKEHHAGDPHGGRGAHGGAQRGAAE